MVDEKWANDNCTCPDCPSFVDCDKDDKVAYCLASVGKSSCIEEEKGCICGSCPVHEKMELKNGYYCTKGSEKEQEKSGDTGSCGSKDE
jgi:hypothetical protein